MKSKGNIILYDKSNHGDLFGFLKEVWPENEILWDEEHWEWKFIKSSDVLNREAAVLMYVLDGDLAGTLGLMPVKL